MIVRGRNALRTSGRAIVIFAMPAVRARGLLVADVRVVAARRWRRLRSRWCSSARRLACAACWSRDGSTRAAARAARRIAALQTPARELDLRASCDAARARRASELAERGAGAGDARRDRAAAPGSASRRRCTPACCSAPSPCRSTCASRERARARSPAARRARSRSRCGAARDRAAARAGAPRPRRDGGRDPHLGHHLGAAAGRADLRQPALERARLGRRARPRPAGALAVRAAALARRRPVDPACARRSTRPPPSSTSASRPTARCDALARERRDARRASSRRRSRGCSTRACATRRRCAARSPAAARCRAALLARARAAGVPVSLTYGLTEACSQVTTTPVAALGERASGAGPPLFCTRVRDRARRRDPRRAARPSRPAARRRTAGCTPATSAPRRATGACA